MIQIKIILWWHIKQLLKIYLKISFQARFWDILQKAHIITTSVA